MMKATRWMPMTAKASTAKQNRQLGQHQSRLRTLIQNDATTCIIYHLQFATTMHGPTLNQPNSLKPRSTTAISPRQLQPPSSSIGRSQNQPQAQQHLNIILRSSLPQTQPAQQPLPSLPQPPQQNEAKTQRPIKIPKQQIKISTNPTPKKQPPQSPDAPDKSLHQDQEAKNGGKPSKRRKQRSYYYDQQDNSQVVQSFKFPFMNEYLKQHSAEYLQTMDRFDRAKEAQGKLVSDTFLNCDVRYFNWQLFAEEVGKFEVVLIDPPWRIKGAQQNDSQFMFSNCKFSLEYNTMANSQIGRIPLHLLADEGFIFVWILNSQLDASIEIMEGWGYELVEEIIWVKLKDEKINLTHGYYFMHSYEVCLVGYKCKKGTKPEQRLKVRHGVSWNTIFAQVREKSQKPEDLYALIDIMFKDGKKIEIFARNHNLRFGIFSMGNQLGESYDKWLLRLECDECGDTLRSGFKRFKSKSKPNYDLCARCITGKDKLAFFQLANDVDQNVRHEYVSCNHCGSQPIWGIRFQCVTCHDFDICENCYDRNLNPSSNFHPLDHEYLFLEVPVFGNGFHIHESKCSSCYQNPIIGIYFSCSSCKNFKLCQKCYFERPPAAYSNFAKRHKPSHQLQVIFQPQMQEDKRYQCFGCKREVLEDCWMCENCYNFFFCQKCFEARTDFKSLYANTHKKYHVLTKIF